MFPFFPYTDFHRLNADWILKTVEEIKTTVELLRGRFETLVLRVNNIDAATQNTVKYTEQDPTTQEQETARVNINAASQTDLATLALLVEQGQDTVLYNGNGTISTAPNILTVEGANEGDTSELGGGFLRLYNALMGSSSAIVITPDAIREAVLRIGITGLPGARVTICNIADPMDGSDAANKDYVDSTVPLKITFSGRGTSARCDTSFANIIAALNAGRRIDAWYSTSDYVMAMAMFSDGRAANTPYIAAHSLTYADGRFNVMRAYMTASSLSITSAYVAATAT